ncbi:hypothetical protein niasHS_012535 [Heterodera schachtii]|uniref:Ubiquitin carboxyl-terminal hydrolase n=1 Tax=Heterodera schachtii TaxID=97005 RepID=A0ABD2IEP2_HETSC
MANKDRASTKNTNKNGCGGSGGGKKLSKKAKRREERTRQQRQKSVSVGMEDETAQLSDNDVQQQGETTQNAAVERRTTTTNGAQPAEQRQQKQQQKQCDHQQSTAVAGATTEVGETKREPMMREPKGLPNLGNTCFFNSTMQCLLTHWPFLRHYFDIVPSLPDRAIRITSPYSARVSDTEVKVPKMEVHLGRDFPMPTFWAFAKFVDSFHKDDTRRPSPAALFDQISKKVPRFRSMAQQDAHELLHYLMDMLRQEELSRFQQAFSTVQYDEDDAGDNGGKETTDGDNSPHNGGDGAGRASSNSSNKDIAKQRGGGKGAQKSQRTSSSTPADRRQMRRRLICRALLNGPARPVVDAIYGGMLQQTIKCERCAHVSMALEPFFDLSLPIKTAAGGAATSSANANRRDNSAVTAFNAVPSLEEALRLFTAEEVLRGDTHAYRCENCTKPKTTTKQQLSDKNKTDSDYQQKETPTPQPLPANARKRYKVLSPPPVLTLHLNRFEQLGRNLRKYNGHVQFPLVLNLAPFCASNMNRLRPGQNRHLLLYRLCGIVSHSGGMGGGHYIAYVARYPPRSDDDDWLQSVDKLFELSLNCSTNIPTSSNSFAEKLADQLGTVALENNTNNNTTQRQQQQQSTKSGEDGDNENDDDKDEEDADDDDQSVSTTSSNGTMVTTAHEQNDATQVQEIEQQALAAAKHQASWFYCSDSHVRSARVDEVLNVQAFLLFYERIY